jgi:hypothetical protein
MRQVNRHYWTEPGAPKFWRCTHPVFHHRRDAQEMCCEGSPEQKQATEVIPTSNRNQLLGKTAALIIVISIKNYFIEKIKLMLAY